MKQGNDQKRFVLLIAFCLWRIIAFGQFNLPGDVSLNTDVHNFGDIKEGNPRVADFIFTNNSTEDVYLLRAVVPEDFIYRYSAQKIAPGQTATIRIKVNRTKLGYFHEIVNIYSGADDEAFAIHITGNIKNVNKNEDPACPDFNEPIESKIVKQDFTVQVIDKVTSQPLNDAIISFDPDPDNIASRNTNLDGICRNVLPVDLYNITVVAPGYETSSQTVYVGKKTTSTVFLLTKQPAPEKDTIIQSQSPPPVTPIKIQAETKDTPAPPVAPVKEKPGELPISIYGANNIVFLLDVSASMETSERLPLVKIAMKKLLYSLRGIDRVSIVTYASGVNVILPSTTADNKEEIAEKIDAMRARGNTEGGKGIREAYKVAHENFISGGNNEIVLATDGDFDLDKSNEALYRLIKHNASDGIIISVVGVGNIPSAIKKMQEIADKGQGSYIHIKTKDEATNVLVDEIKQRSEKK